MAASCPVPPFSVTPTIIWIRLCAAFSEITRSSPRAPAGSGSGSSCPSG
jgi:hypothetical protein